jgi:hypothetical protein
MHWGASGTAGGRRKPAAAGGVLDVSAVPNAGIPSGPRPVARYVAPFIAIKGGTEVGKPQ